MGLQCTNCNTTMTKMNTLDSGNSKFIEYACPGCRETKTICEGLSSLSSV